MAVTDDHELADRIAALAAAEPLPTEAVVRRRLFRGRVARIAIQPKVFTWTLFPVLRGSSWLKANPDVYRRGSIAALAPIPRSFKERYSNAQAAIGIEGLKYLDEWTARAQANAARMTAALRDVPGIQLPVVPADRTHIFYQYRAYVPDRAAVVRQCISRGVDLETLDVDVCTRMPLFDGLRRPAPGADCTAQSVQVPVYESLSPTLIDRIANVVREAVERLGPARRQRTRDPVSS